MSEKEKQKIWNHIYHYWTFDSLINLSEYYLEDDYLFSCDIVPEITRMKQCKTKKELLNNHLETLWKIVKEEYSYA